jgi:hypothetical protein
MSARGNFQKLSIGAAVLVTALFTATASFAQRTGSDWTGDYDARATRRSDFTFGISAGLEVGRARGYPNDLEKIDNPAYLVTTRNTLGGAGTVWAGVALADWLTFALGVSQIRLSSSDAHASGTGFLARVEGFPLFAAGAAWRDIGISGSFGLGILHIDSDQGQSASGPTLSIVSAGAFYEGFRLGPFAAGPILEYSNYFSSSEKLRGTLYGLRIAVYTGPG